MTLVLTLFIVNAVLGAWDTLWYHEWKTRLAERLDTTRTELRLHVARDAVYVVVYLVISWWQVSGSFVVGLAVLLAAEIAITLTDFVIEDRDRPAIGGMAAGERVLHTLMAIVYGAALVTLVPILIEAAAGPDAFVRHEAPLALSIVGSFFAAGIAVTGLRDGLALLGVDPVRLTARQKRLVDRKGVRVEAAEDDLLDGRVGARDGLDRNLGGGFDWIPIDPGRNGGERDAGRLDLVGAGK